MKFGAFFISALLFVPTLVSAQTPLPSCMLGANPSSVQLGGTVTLSWTSTAATSGAIVGIGNVSLNGSKQIIPTRTTTYVGSFSGPGGTANCSVTISVTSQSGGGGSDSLGGSGVIDANGVVPVVTPVSGPLPKNPTINVPSSAVSGSIGPLVPCNGIDCQLCSLAKLSQNIINFLVGLSIPIAIALLAYAGYLYFSSGVNVGNITKAKGIFSAMGIGFIIIVAAFLGIQTVLKVVLAPGYYQSWNNIQCVAPGSRQTNATISQLLSSLPGLNNGNTGGQSGGGSLSGSGGQTVSDIANTYGQTTGGSSGFTCDAGYVPREDATEYWCENPWDSKDISTPHDNENVPVSTGSLAQAIDAYKGTDTSAGPDGGNLACAWAVNNILKSEGIAPVDNNLVADMQKELDAGRGTPIALADAQKGDIIVWKNDTVSHVGFCDSASCTTAISNSSGDASFTNVSGPVLRGVTGQVYRLK